MSSTYVRHYLVFAVVALLTQEACTQPPTDDITNPSIDTNKTIAPATTTEPNDTIPNNNLLPPPPVSPNIEPNKPVAIEPNLAIGVPGPVMRVVGRTVSSNSNQPVISWPASQIYAGFTGTSLRVVLDGLTQHSYGNIGKVSNHFNVSIDGKAPVHMPAIANGAATYVLASNLPEGNHQVVLTKRTEGQIGSVQCVRFLLDNNATLISATAPPDRRIEFIGDSGTVGYGADGNDLGGNVCTFTAATENAAGSYSALTARALGADVHITGNSGKGIYQNRDPINDNVNTLPEIFRWAEADTQRDTGTWDPHLWQPQAVVVVVGGNDFAASIPSPQAYAAVANKFIKQLRTAYPQAWLFVTISPMLDSKAETPGRQYAQAMVTAAQDAKVAYIDTPVDDGSRRYGCDYHLSPASNIYYANLFAKAIAAKTGWGITPL